MPEVAEAVRIAASAGPLWREIGGFGAVGGWHPMLARVTADGEHPGAIRTAHGMDGSVRTERLLESSPGYSGYR